MTQKELKQIYEKYDELEKQKQTASELLRTAQDRFQHTEVEIEREGKKIKVPQKYLWKEVWENGSNSQAGQVLKEKHPQVFEAYDKESQIAKEINEMVFKIFGIASHQQMSLRDILTIVESVIDMKLNKNKK